MLTKPVEKQHTDTVVNFLIRIACQVNDSTNVAGSPGELLSRRCVSLMKSALRPDMWPRAELKLQWFDKLLMTVVRRRACLQSEEPSCFRKNKTPACSKSAFSIL
ncbi:Transformation/transcription domain-associated protein [Liparis tanakae]|uniref:Transformation/transcription domain-associated protein n=1 Tax=Liparis tanakae TaxID=230148 RepID=A0A4Z2G841_9TELE|nr:Transformation/transcription domain-associated protein [Liparis tanakae]